MASEEKREDGRDYTVQAAEILTKINEELDKLVDRLGAERVKEWQTTLKTFIADIPLIQKKLFLKTQGGTTWAKEALEKVQALEQVLKGASESSSEEAVKALDESIAEVKKVLGGLIEKAKTLVIRMT